MLSLQWEFLKSGAYSTVEIFRTLRETASLLWEFNFSLAGGKLCEAGKNALIALEKFALGLSLLLLHTIRLLTILVATFFPHILILSLIITFAYFTLPLLGVSQIGALILGASLGTFGIIAFMVGRVEGKADAKAVGVTSNNFFGQSRTSIYTQILRDLNEYDTISEEIFAEREQIIAAIKNAFDDQDQDDQEQNEKPNARYQFFQESAMTPQQQRLIVEAEEFMKGLTDLINGYPRLNAARAKAEPNYLSNHIKELMEHHAKTKQVAEICLGFMTEPSNVDANANSLKLIC
ncbi:hypothetical protein [Legionella sp.]|uniref:hypothetical protein n=1 Tax=Legionella sp. TaxID=459 RepID=UPI00321FEA28